MSKMFLNAEGSDDILEIPVLPAELSISREGGFEDSQVLQLGSISLPSGASLESFSFESFIPVDNTRFNTAEKVTTATDFIAKIKNWMGIKGKAQTPIRFIYTGGALDINGLYIITEFTHTEVHGTSDINYSIGFTEYVPYNALKIKPVPPPKPKAPDPSSVNKEVPKTQSKPKVVKKDVPVRPPVQKPTTYKLVAGDSLWRVAQRYTGNGVNFEALAKLNNIKAADYRRLPIGLELKIPTDWTAKK